MFFELASTVISVPPLRTWLVGSGGCGWPDHCSRFLVLSRKKEIHLQSFLPLQSALVLTSDWHRPEFSPSERTGTDFSAIKHQSTSQLRRTRPLTSSPRSWSCDSLTRKVGSAFFRTHVYCGSSPCLADPALLSVVGFCGQSEYCKVTS